MVQKKNRLDKYLYHHSEWNLAASNFQLAACLKWHGFQPVSFTMPYSNLYILTELSASDVKFISVDRHKLDLSKYIYLWYRKFYICRDTAWFYDHKKWPSYDCHTNKSDIRQNFIQLGSAQWTNAHWWEIQFLQPVLSRKSFADSERKNTLILHHYMRLNVRKPDFGFCDQVVLKLACSATETS